MIKSPTKTQNFNRYAYVLNNPLRYTDPTGHYEVEEANPTRDQLDKNQKDHHEREHDNDQDRREKQVEDWKRQQENLEEQRRLEEQWKQDEALINSLNDSWFFQAGLVGSTSAFLGLGGDVGLFVGTDKNGRIKTGYYGTGTAIVGSSVGGDAGLILSYGNTNIEDIAGWSDGYNIGLDTFVLDVMVGVEEIANGTAQVFNVSITLGFEPSATIVGGMNKTTNRTIIKIYD